MTMFYGYSATLYGIQYIFTLIVECTCRNLFLQTFYYKLNLMMFSWYVHITKIKRRLKNI